MSVALEAACRLGFVNQPRVGDELIFSSDENNPFTVLEATFSEIGTLLGGPDDYLHIRFRGSNGRAVTWKWSTLLQEHSTVRIRRKEK